MRDAPFRVTVHYEGGRTTRQDLYTRKAARLSAKRIAGTVGVLRITLEAPGECCELWAKGDDDVKDAPAPMPAPRNPIVNGRIAVGSSDRRGGFSQDRWRRA